MNKIINLIFVLVLLAINVNAVGFGVTQPSTIFLPPGENKIVEFSVQTGAGDKEAVIATLGVIKGSEIIELIEDTKYLVPASGETKARIKLNMPENAKPEDIWKIVLEFKAAPINPEENNKMVSLEVMAWK